MAAQLPVAIVGASGYAGEELVRLLIAHPKVALEAVTSRQHAGKQLSEVFPQMGAASKLRFSGSDVAEVGKAEIVFLALPHGESRHFAAPLLEQGKRVYDLSADFRIKDRELFAQYYHGDAPEQALLAQAVYGSPETNREAIVTARLVACPGCYPTSVLLALAPALASGLVKTDSIIIHSLSGISGAGRKLETPFLFVESNENARSYGISNHRHVPEIEQELSRVAMRRVQVQFTPNIIPVTRGMTSSIVARPAQALPTALRLSEIYESYYADKPFVRFCGQNPPEMKWTTHTNRCDVSARVDERTNHLLLFSALDNLGKGAAGQAVQCMNIALGWDETEGLQQ